MFIKYLFFLTTIVFVSGNMIIKKQNYEDEMKENEKFSLIRAIVDTAEDSRGWINFIVVGYWPDSFYKKIQGLHMTFVVTNDDYKGYIVEETIRYRGNTMVIDCEDYKDFEKKINIARNTPYWHPHTNTIVYYHNVTESKDIIARIFYALWYYKSANAIIMQFSDGSDTIMVTHYSPFISEKFEMEHNYGCWTQRKITLKIRNLEDGIFCTKECHNVTLHSKLRADYFGTCIGFETIVLPNGNTNTTKLQEFQLFEDKGKNLHGFTLKAYASEVMPFFIIDEHSNGTFTLHERDGLLWNTMAEIMNFTIDLSLSASTMKDGLDFELCIRQISNFARRKGDLVLTPVYNFDLIVVEVDMTYPYKGSGLCIMSHRAGYETTLFDIKMLQSNYRLLIKFLFCFLSIWFVFFVFNVVEKDVITYDQAGKDFINAIRNILSVSLYKPPKRGSFKIFLLISIWSFFIMNFATQAAIISFFSAFKRGKDVDTFEDVIEKGYIVEGLASPDVMLPQTDERFQKINSKLVPVRDLFGCVKQMTNDSRRFCLIDCSVGRYLERNQLNEKGEQYLHIAKDQIHSHYLIMLLQPYSALTNQYNGNIHKFLQAGLINKWEQYRYEDIKNESTVKSLNMDDLIGIFKCYIFLVGLSIVTFVLEVCNGARKGIIRCFKQKILKWKRTRAAKNVLDLERKQGKITLSNSSTQTID